ncbi:MAG: PilN domain-containing protein [Candidatus Saccharimonas sp.]
MINLLPPSYQKELAASRTNTLLRRYVILLFGLVIIMMAEVGVVFFFLNTVKVQNQARIDENNQKTASYSSVKKEADEFRNNLTTAKKILGQQVSYTQLIKLLSDLLPPNVVIDQLSLDPSTFGVPTTLSVRAKGYNDAIVFRAKLNESAIFSSVNFQSITLQEQDTTGYPYTSTFNVTFKKGLGQ